MYSRELYARFFSFIWTILLTFHKPLWYLNIKEMDKAVIIFMFILVLPLSGQAQNWTTFSKDDFGHPQTSWWAPISGIKAFRVNNQNGDIWWARFATIYNIDPSGDYTTHSNATDPVLPSSQQNCRMQHVEIFKDEVYCVNENGGDVFRYDGTQWNHFNGPTDAFFLSVDEDSLWVCQIGENMRKYVDGIPTYYPEGQRRVQSRKGITWSTGSNASNNGGLIRFYEPMTFDYRSADTADFVLDNYPNDFKFMNNSDTFYLAGNQGFSIAIGAQFIDTLTANNTINQPSGKIVEFEFDSNDNIWALFGTSISASTHLGYLDRTTNEWTVYDQNNSPINFPYLMSLELDGEDNVYVITPENLHILEVGNVPGWLNTNAPKQIGFEVFPNPSNGSFSISIDPSLKVETIEILDYSGRVIKSLNFEESINVDLDQGSYLIQLKNGDTILASEKHVIN
ncbi:MAG: hypothetical protein Crog4KO_25880 [Crocinitomicaceae bacterium]